MCRKGDNEELLLLCDGCDKGCHTYCHKPQISTIPEGDWFCPACIAKVGEAVLWSKKEQNIILRPSTIFMSELHTGNVGKVNLYTLSVHVSNFTNRLPLLTIWPQASDSSQKGKKQTSRLSGGVKKPSEVKRSKKACVAGDGSEDDTTSTSACSTPKKGGKEIKKKKTENLFTDAVKEESSTQVKKAKTARDNSKDVELCRYLDTSC